MHIEPLSVPLLSRRFKRGQAAQKINHAVPAAGLIYSGVQALSHGAGGLELLLAVVEIVTSACLIAAIVRAFRAARKAGVSGLHHGHGVNWIDLWAAGVLLAEAAERWHLNHHIARPIILNAVLTIFLALFHDRLAGYGERRRSLRLSDDGVYVGGRPFNNFRAPWEQIAAIAVDQRRAEIRTRAGGVRRIDLADMENAPAVRDALLKGQQHLEARRLLDSETPVPSNQQPQTVDVRPLPDPAPRIPDP